MKRLALAVVFVLGFVPPAWADFQAGFAAWDRGDYATALREWKPLAEQGDAVAQFNLGLMYDNGYGVPQDYVRAAMMSGNTGAGLSSLIRSFCLHFSLIRT